MPHPHDRRSPDGISPPPVERCRNRGGAGGGRSTSTQGAEATVPSASAFGDAFELYVLRLLRVVYPHYAWYHQGRNKRHERGVDFVGNRLGDVGNEPGSIGVQVKFHKATNAPTNEEWPEIPRRLFRSKAPFGDLRDDGPFNRRAKARGARGQGHRRRGTRRG